MEAWQVVAAIIAAGCYAGAARPVVRRLAERWAQLRALADAEREHRRATCPNRPGPRAKVIVQGGWCDWCRITHDQRMDELPNLRREVPYLAAALDTGTLRCSNVAPYVHGGVCSSCGAPHVEMPRPGRGERVSQ